LAPKKFKYFTYRNALAYLDYARSYARSSVIVEATGGTTSFRYRNQNNWVFSRTSSTTYHSHCLLRSTPSISQKVKKKIKEKCSDIKVFHWNSVEKYFLICVNWQLSALLNLFKFMLNILSLIQVKFIAALCCQLVISWRLKRAIWDIIAISIS